MQTLRVAALTALATVAVACGGSSSGGSSSPSSTSPSPSSGGASSAPATGSAPSDPTAAKAAITKNWQTFLASGTSPAVAKSLLENGDQMGVALKKATAEDKATGGARSASVKKITFTSATTANVTYTLHAAGQVLNAAGTAVLQNGVWKVTDVTFCTLVVLGNGSKPVKGCPS